MRAQRWHLSKYCTVDHVDHWYVGLKWERNICWDRTLLERLLRTTSLFDKDFLPLKVDKRVMQKRRGDHLNLSYASYEEQPIQILEANEYVLQGKAITLVRVLW